MILVMLVAGLSSAETATSAEQRASQRLAAIKHQPGLLLAFVEEFPKGADLHNHLAGAVYAETYIDFASQNGLCVDRTTAMLLAPPCDASCDKYNNKPAVGCAYQDQVLYNSLIDAWSMRNWSRSDEPGHDHFFATFYKFELANLNHTGDAIAQAASQAARDHVQYLELMHTADGWRAAALGAKLAWNPDFSELRQQLQGAGLADIVASTRKDLDAAEQQMRSRLKCGGAQAEAGCRVTIRYLYQVLRGLSPQQVFAQILTGFELAQADPRVVGLNLVMAEDWYVPMRDFHLHMTMLDYLHALYPRVHISLHAGELAMGLVAPEGLRFHIRESIELGHAERIGHGVSVMEEDRPIALLEEMAARKILVEICLTSNDEILGVRDEQEPLPVYLRYGVPVAIATDDEGVSRSDMTHEYLRAIESYDLSYSALKRMARASVEHSFLPGASLWSAEPAFTLAPSCASDSAGSEHPSAACQALLRASDKAREQWKLEGEFARFERNF
jgi:adenosine deaminase